MKLSVSLALGAAMISASALAQAPGGERGGWMQRDQTRAEAKQRADMLFQMLDANHDGTVTRSEAEQAAAQFAARRGEDGSAQRGGGRIERMVTQLFASSDSLTLAQFEAQTLARFDALDLNHDGVVTAAERDQARAQRQGQVQPAAPAPQPAPSKPQ